MSLGYGPVRALPTRTFFYGMEPGEEISIEIDPGKTLELRLQAVGETTEEGDARVFFELNGQPRTIRVADRKASFQAFVEGFERLFHADQLPLRWLRNAGLKLVDQMPEAKAVFVRQALGLTGDLPELAKF